jgi:hypothetical protein
MDELPTREVMRRWWAHMAELMATNPDGSPVAVPLRRVFHLPWPGLRAASPHRRGDLRQRPAGRSVA